MPRNEFFFNLRKSLSRQPVLVLTVFVLIILLIIFVAFFPTLSVETTFILALLIVLLTLLALSSWIGTELYSSSAEQQERIAEAEAKAESQSEKAKPFWDVAQTKLETYIDTNARQVRNIFTLSIIVMSAGFLLVIGGIGTAFVMVQTSVDDMNATSRLNVAVVSVAAGVIIDFIGATFLFLYRSTVVQAISYVDKLERMNNVGMAMQILDIVSETAKQSKEDQTKVIDAKIEIAKQLLSTAQAVPRIELPISRSELNT